MAKKKIKKRNTATRKNQARKRLPGKPKSRRRNIGPLISAVQEGLGFALGERALSGLRKKKKAAARRKPARKARRNPEGRHAIAVGSGKRKLILAGPANKLKSMAANLRRAHVRVTSGKLMRRTRGQKKNPGLLATVGEALVFAGAFKGVDMLTEKLGKKKAKDN
jgi:hypothetical protein